MKRLPLLTGLLILLSGALPLLLFAAAAGQLPAAAQPEGRTFPLIEQAALALAVYGFKFVYMALALFAILLVWNIPELAALRWSLIFFEAGELFCGANILFFVEENVALEYLHSWAMVVCLGMLAFAALQALDGGLLHFSAPNERCALVDVCNGYCRGCAKHTDRPCVLRRLFKGLLPIMMVIAAMPLNAEPVSSAYDTLIFTLPRTLIHPMPIQFYEMRFCPWAAIILLGISWLILMWRGHTESGMQRSKIFLAAAIGHLGFTFMRLAFFGFYRPNLIWFFFWEELTELILIVGIIFAVWLFRPELPRRLFTFWRLT